MRQGRLLGVAELWTAIALWFLIGLPPELSAQRPPPIAAAANLNFALEEVAKRFEGDEATKVELVFGASGTLTRQIRDGAPFELFLAADEEFPNQLTKAGLTRDPGVVYAVGRLVMFAPTGSALTVDERLEGLARLRQGWCGQPLRDRQSRRRAVRPGGGSGAAQARVVGHDSSAAGARRHDCAGGAVRDDRQCSRRPVAYSLVLAPGFADRGKYAVIPAADHPPLRQRMVLLKRAGAVARQFYAYVQSAPARSILRKHGYEVPR